MYNTQYDTLKTIVAAIADDVTKANAGNKSAKVRIRQALQQLKKHAQEFRLVLTEPTTPLEQDM